LIFLEEIIYKYKIITKIDRKIIKREKDRDKNNKIINKFIFMF
jgi:hypothetical protein